VSKERARRRAERAAVAARAAERQAVRQVRAARRRTLLERCTALLPRPARYRRQRGILAARRRAQNASLLGIFLLIQLVAWLLLAAWPARLSVLALSLFLTPVLAVLLFDRGRSS
jgi:hypothetical protein